MVLVSTIGGGIVVPMKDGGNWILLFPRPIAVAAGCCYTGTTTTIGRRFLPPATPNAETGVRRFGVVEPVHRSRFDRRVLHDSICFPGFRRLVSTKTTIQGLPDGDNAAVASVGDAEHQHTWCAGSDCQCPWWRCVILLVTFGILP